MTTVVAVHVFDGTAPKNDEAVMSRVYRDSRCGVLTDMMNAIHVRGTKDLVAPVGMISIVVVVVGVMITMAVLATNTEVGGRTITGLV